MYHFFFRIWDILPNMPEKRASHGCTRVAMHNTDYLAILGGSNSNVNYLNIQFFNIAQKHWETSITTINLPSTMSEVKGVIGSRLDPDGCDLMILFGWPSQSLYVCTGNYTWKSIDATGKLDQTYRGVVVGANELLPCGTE